MTVITFAKQGTCYSAFGSRTAIHRIAGRAKTRERGIVFAAAVFGALGALGIFALGIRTTLLTLSLADQTEQIAVLEEKIEQLRIEALNVSNPQYITERARMLQLVSGSEARYVTIGVPEEFAMTR